MSRIAARGRVGAIVLAFAALCAAVVPPAAADTSSDRMYVDTVKVWDGEAYIFPFNAGRETQTYGQTITAPERTTLLGSFTFLVKLPPSTQFRAFLYAWDPWEVHAVRPALWVSAARTTEGFDWATTKFYVHRNLIAGQRYVVLLTTLGVPQSTSTEDGQFAVASWDGVYPGGSFIFTNSATFDGLTTQRWSRYGNADLAFRAKFMSP